jgi:hypothetical protein
MSVSDLLVACVSLSETLVACALAVSIVSAPSFAATASPAPSSPTTLGARLHKAGSARARFVRIAEDPQDASDVPRSEPGWLELEPPGRARLEFSRTGEKITLRPDGGEWLQPGLHQMITLDSLRAAVAGRWWQLLMSGRSPGITVWRRGAREVTFIPAGDAGPDSAVLHVDAAGLPAELAVTDAAGVSRFRFSNWTFLQARGEAAYRQHAPTGFEVVPLP